jgi:hypothetical protein
MAAPKFYEGQEFHNPSDPTAPVLVYRAGKFLPKDAVGALNVTPKLGPQDSTYLAGLRTNATKSLDTATQAERFMALNRQAGTGGALALPLMSDIAAAVSPKHGEMESITSQVAPGLRPPGSGSSSDKDVKFYRRGFPNLDFPGDTNEAIAKRLHMQSDQAAAHAAFVDSWVQHKGSLLGAEPAFTEYWATRTAAPAKAAAGGLKTQGDGWRIIP